MEAKDQRSIDEVPMPDTTKRHAKQQTTFVDIEKDREMVSPLSISGLWPLKILC